MTRRFAALDLAVLLFCAAVPGCRDKTRDPAPAAEPSPTSAAPAPPATADAGSVAATVETPSGEAREIDPASASLVVAMQKDGKAMINGVAVSDAELEQTFRDAFKRDPVTQVIIRPDAGVSHGRVVAVMELAKAAGLTKLAIATKSAP